MNKDKQIEEMARDICHAPTCKIKKNGGACYKYCKAYIYAFRAVNAGYRKQSEGEWIDKPTGAYGRMQSWCSACGKHSGIGGIESNRHKPFCPNCGAKMRGGE